MSVALPSDLETAAYASHWRLLTRLFHHFPIKRVLETGSGLYSTPLLLSFGIDRLVSIENNPDWALPTGDPRHELIQVEGPIVDHLPDLDAFDLVFVDDDPVWERELTFRHVIEHATGLIVIHDSDHPVFNRWVTEWPHITDDQHDPHTAVLCPSGSKEFDAWRAMQ